VQDLKVVKLPRLFYWSHIGKRLIHFVPLPIALLAGMGFVAVFSELLTPIALHDYGNGTLWNGKWTIYRTCLFYSLFGIGISRYLPQIVKGPKYLLYQKFKRGKLDNF
jgi:hypothetical protein